METKLKWTEPNKRETTETAIFEWWDLLDFQIVQKQHEINQGSLLN